MRPGRSAAASLSRRRHGGRPRAARARAPGTATTRWPAGRSRVVRFTGEIGPRAGRRPRAPGRGAARARRPRRGARRTCATPRSALPWVRDARVRRVFPDTLEIADRGARAARALGRARARERARRGVRRRRTRASCRASPGPRAPRPRSCASTCAAIDAAPAPLAQRRSRSCACRRAARWQATLASGLAIDARARRRGARALARFAAAWPRLDAQARAGDARRPALPERIRAARRGARRRSAAEGPARMNDKAKP